MYLGRDFSMRSRYGDISIMRKKGREEKGGEERKRLAFKLSRYFFHIVIADCTVKARM